MYDDFGFTCVLTFLINAMIFFSCLVGIVCLFKHEEKHEKKRLGQVVNKMAAENNDQQNGRQ